MVDIEQQAIQTFQANYKYFAAHHPELYQKIEILQQAIEQNQYRENYTLEYVDGYFDVKALGNGQFLYGSDSDTHALKAAEDVSFKKSIAAIKTFYTFPYTQANIDDLDKLSIINSWMTGTAPLVQFANENIPVDSEMKKIHKFIFFGAGIGKHLEAIHKKIAAESYFIIEDNLELFRLSMFVTNYAELGRDAKLFFAVMSNVNSFKNSYNQFAEDLEVGNSYLKFHLLSEQYAPKIKQIQNFAVTKSHLLYPYNYLLHKNLQVSKGIFEHYNFLNISKPFENGLFAEKPLLFLAAGPSLKKQLLWVKEHQNAYVIVAVFMISATLEAAGIIPDIVIHVDENSLPVIATMQKMKNSDFLKESLFVLAASAPLEHFSEIAKKENTFLIEDRTRYKVEHGFIEFFSVGEVGYALSLIFGTKDIYLLGLDLAVDQKTGKTHSEGHETEDAVDIKKGEDGPEEVASLRDTLIPIRGNYEPKIYTTPLFDTSIFQLNYFTKLYKQDFQNVYNLGDGAYFNDTVVVQPSELQSEPFDKKAHHKKIYALLKQMSTDDLSAQEKNNLDIRKKELKKKAKIIERFSREPLKSVDAFEIVYKELCTALIRPVVLELKETPEIFLNYFQTVGSYIGDFINTKEIENSEVKVKALQSILSRQLYKILHAFSRFDFDYIKGEKYFDTGDYTARQDEIIRFEIKAIEVSQLDEIYATDVIKE